MKMEDGLPYVVSCVQHPMFKNEPWTPFLYLVYKEKAGIVEGGDAKDGISMGLGAMHIGRP